MKIGIQTAALRGRRTGVGNYSFNLLHALAELDPRLEFLTADLLRWKPIDLHVFDDHHGDCGEAPLRRALRVPDMVQRAARNSHLARKSFRLVANALQHHVYQSDSIDLFHAFNYLPPVAPRARVLPVVYDLSFVRYPDMHPKERLQRLSGLHATLEAAPLIHAISEFGKREIVEVYGTAPERIFVAYPAASSHFRRMGADQTRVLLRQLDLQPQTYVLAVGTLEPRKNLKTLVAAYARLPRPLRSRFPLAIVGGAGWGDTELPAETEAMIQEGSVRFTGFVSDAVLQSLYEGARLLAYPSIYEGFGMPVVEAMACGTPVAHSSGTSMDEIGGDLVTRIAPLDVDAWTACLTEALTTEVAESHRQQLVARARRFDWTESAHVVLDAYRRLG